MDERTRTALEGSIAKWQAIVAGTGVDQGTNNCPLCWEFFDKGCAGCPVAAASGKRLCNNTPYVHFDNHSLECEESSCPDCRRLAQAELDFLVGLRPRGGEPV